MARTEHGGERRGSWALQAITLSYHIRFCGRGGYFRSRPLASRLGAWASPQSEVIPNREWLQVREKNLQQAFPAETSVDPPRPSHWGGYRLSPDQFEFWQGRPSRLHDRIRYRKNNAWSDQTDWIIERLAP